MNDVKYIHSVYHGKYGVGPGDIPCCPECGQPMTVGERIELQTCDRGPGEPDALRLVHDECANPEDYENEDSEDEDDEE